MNKKILSVLVLVLTLVFSTKAFASLTFTANAITGTSASTIDLGAGNTLSLQTTGNAPITTGTGLVTLGGALNVTTSVTSPLLIGGSAVGSKITYKSTTGVGTVTGIAHQFTGGTDGGTVLATILNNGKVGIGTTAPAYNLDVTGTGNFSGALGALNFYEDANDNIAVGSTALRRPSSQSNNIAIGKGSLAVANGGQGQNVAIGIYSLNHSTNNNYNTAIGAYSLYNYDTAENVAVGYKSLYTTQYGIENTAVGAYSLYTMGDNGYSTAVGYKSLQLSTGKYNVAMGSEALMGETTGWDNVAIGHQAGYRTGSSPNIANALTTGGDNTFIGYHAGLGSATQRDNATAIGSGAYVDADNTVVLGDDYVVNVLAGSSALAKVKAGSLQLTTGTRPTCDTTTRGTTWYVAGGAGVADTVEMCGKAAAGTYSWVALATLTLQG